MTAFIKPPRLAVLDTLPSEIRDNALLDWRTFATLIDKKDVDSARDYAARHGLPLVNTGRRKLPRWKDVKALLDAQTITPTE